MLADTKEDFLEEEQLQQTPIGHKSLLDSNLRYRGRCCVCVCVCVCVCLCVHMYAACGFGNGGQYYKFGD